MAWILEESRLLICFPEDDEPIFNLAVKGDLQKLHDLLTSNKTLVKKIRLCDGASPLTLAARERKIEIMTILIDEGCDINHANDSSGWSALHISCLHRDIAMVNLLLKKGAIVNMKTNAGRTPLHIAAENNDIGVMNILLENGAEVNSLCYESWTPLMDACNAGSVAAIELLIAIGATSERTDTTIFINGKPATAFDLLLQCPDLAHSEKLRIINLPSTTRGLYKEFEF